MVTIIKVRPDGTHKEFYCDTKEYADEKIKSNPKMFMTVEDFEKMKPEQAPKIPDADREAKIEELVKQGFSREYAEKAIE